MREKEKKKDLGDPLVGHHVVKHGQKKELELQLLYRIKSGFFYLLGSYSFVGCHVVNELKVGYHVVNELVHLHLDSGPYWL